MGLALTSVFAFGALIPIANQAMAVAPNIMPRLLPTLADVNGDGELDGLTLFMTQVQNMPDLTSVVVANPDPLSYVSGIRPFSLTDGSQLADFTGQRVDDFFGFDAVNAGDVDGDGFDDLFVGSPLAGVSAPDNEPGKVELLSGATQATVWSFDGQPGEKLGVELAYVGDVNGDGVTDFAAASILSSANAQGAGRVYILSGVDGQPIRTIDGVDPFGAFGFALAGVGDVDADGVPDLAVGEPFDPTNADPNAMGVVHLISGKTGLPIASSQSPSPGASDGFGNSITILGDINGDTISDLLVTAPARGNGRAYIISGADLSLIRELAGSLDPAERFAFDGIVRDVSTTLPVADTIEVVSIKTMPDGTVAPRGWVYNVSTGALLFVQSPDGSAVAALLNADVNVDGIVDMKDVALIPPRTVTFVTSRADANRDGTVDAADLTYIMSKLGALSPAAPSETIAGCIGVDGQPINQCLCQGVPNLQDVMFANNCDNTTLAGGGGTTNPPPNWAQYAICVSAANKAKSDKINDALTYAALALDGCAVLSAIDGLLSLRKGKFPWKTSAKKFAICSAGVIAAEGLLVQKARSDRDDAVAKCKVDNHIP